MRKIKDEKVEKVGFGLMPKYFAFMKDAPAIQKQE